MSGKTIRTVGDLYSITSIQPWTMYQPIKCAKPDCDRGVTFEGDYCCEGCEACAKMKCEIHPGTGPLSHTEMCNGCNPESENTG